MLISEINNYSSFLGSIISRFQKKGVKYKFDVHNFHLNPRVNYGVNIGVKGKFYFLETGLCLDQSASDIEISIEYNNLTKTLTYHNQVYILGLRSI